MASDDTSLQRTRVWIIKALGNALHVGYQTLPANDPNTYGNKIYVWEGTAIPWSDPQRNLLAEHEVDGAGELGDCVIDIDLGGVAYIVGYAVADSPGAICASADVEATLESLAEPAPWIGNEEVKEGQVTVDYRMLRGYQPKKFSNWVGLWRGEIDPYDDLAPLARSEVSESANEGSVELDLIKTLRPGSYSLVYFAGKERMTAACMRTFYWGGADDDE